MCGIAGFVGAGTRDDLTAMTRALVHRGPDGEGLYVDPARRVFLGQRRLAVIDIEGGAQPLWNEDASVCVIYNGEIYNHAELRRDLVACGHVFHTDHSDTEVLVHGYEEWGSALPGRLNGMFAFAIYDLRHGKIFLARDRFGEKPLYYLRRAGRLAFASELHAIRKHPDLITPIDPLAVQKYFAHGFIPAPNALYKECHKLPGGMMLTYDIGADTHRLERYWQFALQPHSDLAGRSEGELAEELRERLFDATRRRLISDVPLGLFLSGGIDSGAVLAAAKHASNDLIQTFTIGFTEASYDESGPAQALADYFHTQHHNRTLDIDLAKHLVSEVLPRMDEPIADPSILPTYLLSKFTRERVTVALSGDGGDELFAGYDPFSALGPAAAYGAMVPGPLHRMLRALVERLPASEKNMSLDFKLKRTLLGLSYPQALWNPVWLGPLPPEAAAEIFSNPFPVEEIYSEVLAGWNRDPALTTTERVLEYYTNFYLQDDILTKVDRAAMMNSLESRAVFLDNDLVDFCTRLPTAMKYRRGQRKYLLKKALEPLLPADVLKRRKKGFGIPAARWLKSMDPTQAGHASMNDAAIASRWKAHQGGRTDHRLFLWAALAFDQHLQGHPA